MTSDSTLANTNFREPKPMRVQSDLARKLKEYAGGKYDTQCIYSFEWEAAERINTLESQSVSYTHLTLPTTPYV